MKSILKMADLLPSMKNVTDYKFRQKTNFMVLRKMNTWSLFHSNKSNTKKEIWNEMVDKLEPSNWV